MIIYKNPLCIFLLLLFFAACNQAKITSEVRRPNVIIILSDDQGYGDFSLSGNPDISTPNIDDLAKNGAMFSRFYVSPVCSPTRAELLTGRYHPRSAVYSTSQGGERINLDEKTIAEIFKEDGYKTAAYGKWHNGMQYPYHPNGRGFNDFYGFCSGHWGNYFNPMLEHNGEIVKGDGFIIDDLTNHALNFIETNKESPFFLYLPYNTPHSPMQVPDKWWNKFKDKKITTQHAAKDKEDQDHTRAVYALCENIDWNVGRLKDKLRELNLETNTIIIYLSDNGPDGWRWNGGLKGIKGHTDEGGVRTPLLIQWIGQIKKGLEIKNIAAAIDLLPTLTDLTGIKFYPAKPLDGRSLKPLIMDQEKNGCDRFIFSYWKGNISLRNQQFMLDQQNRLFDLEADPGQSSDISSLYPDTLDKFLTAKKEWQKEVLSELPAVDKRPFPVGHPDYTYTQLPARDAIAHGNIKRSNRWPNCSFFTNWNSVDDSITWDIDVQQQADYLATIYYTCREENLGSVIQLSFLGNKIQKKITEAHDPPLFGQKYDRVKRQESYVKDFKSLHLGIIRLNKNSGRLTLKALDKSGSEIIDFRLIMLKKIDS